MGPKWRSKGRNEAILGLVTSKNRGLAWSDPVESSGGDCRVPALFPPERRQAWLDSVLAEIASGRAVRSRGKRNPRGVRRKMTAYHVRKRGDPINQRCGPAPRMIVK